MTELEEVKLPDALSDLLFDKSITPKQRKFILLFVHSEGLKTATQCAVEAGYAAGSAKTRASELQNPDRYPLVAEHLLKGTNVVRKDPYLHWQELETKHLLLVITMLL